MFRRPPAFALLVGLVATQTGCHTRCDQRPAVVSSGPRTGTPCQPVGRSGGCFDAATGQPVPCPPDVPTSTGPGAPYSYPPIGPMPSVGPRPVELPMPAENIPRPAVPYPAPADASLPYPIVPGVPVKVGPNK
ncbi:hypothetical protein FTUN_5458 [Frigoriglobus tundricola]|uniref:Uncharacterized protein n=1 Tax=Frigoriglobus tundricola TaxID=2774151 RepID=A0A6M5YV94_9BACT|nr:hypothetical protein FTUN_5458 [Frigoriglobus tundricola]